MDFGLKNPEVQTEDRTFSLGSRDTYPLPITIIYKYQVRWCKGLKYLQGLLHLYSKQHNHNLHVEHFVVQREEILAVRLSFRLHYVGEGIFR